MKILHITTHLGGGVGKAIIGMASHKSTSVETKIIVLEEPEKRRALDSGRENGIDIFICPTADVCSALMKEADIVIINWWNHPLMTKFLYEIPQIECRLVAWVHVNGCTYPYVPVEFIDRFDYVFFTSKYSYENDLWHEDEVEKIKTKSTVILGNGNFMPDKMPQKKISGQEDEFRLGYVGTLNYSKINRNYVAYCEAAMKVCRNLKVILVGDVGEDLKNDIEKSVYSNCFELLGYMEDVEAVYLSFDVLGYILNEDNYGTTENVLLEAMAYGIPIVANDSGVERNIIDNSKNGFLVNNVEAFADCVKNLQDDVKLRSKIGKAARKKACNEFSSENNYYKYQQCCKQICFKEKKIHIFSDLLGENPQEWFLYFTGKDRTIFEDFLKTPSKKTRNALVECRPIYKGDRKSSIKHYLSYFPEEKELIKMVRVIEEGRENDSEI